ncbi:MAG: hypothetical protein HYR74_03415 [Candidatus Eisenbacteria bacterium]|nr:hypothetical protein [Candidatus Eisenbacteria bacterium]
MARLARALPLAVLAALPAALLHARVAAAADPLRLIQSDDRGVTLELPSVSFTLVAAGTAGENQGRTRIVSPGLAGHGAPGRPVIPGAATLVALPPGAHATARVIEGDEVAQDGVRLAPGDKHGFADDRTGLGLVPTAEPVPAIRDGIWPPAPVEVGAPFTLRGQRMVSVRVLPFRYDEAAGRLWMRKRMRVRVDFGVSASASGATRMAMSSPGTLGGDRHWDPVLQAALINYDQGRPWRAAIGPPAGGLFDRAGASRAPGAASRRPGVAGVASEAPILFDESDVEVRVQLDSTAVYAISYDQLAAQGYPAGVPINEVSLHRHEYLEDASPAYGTIELPIEVLDANNNNVFDSGDRILAYVRSWAERSGASLAQRIYGDGDVVFATRVARGGLRIATRNGARGQVGLTPVASYPWTQRWEGNFVYMPIPGVAPAETLYDQWHWTSYLPYYAPPDTFLFDANDIDTTHAISFTIALQGRKNGMSYLTYARVHDGNYASYGLSVFDSLLWSGKINEVVTKVLPGSALTEGPGNGVILYGRNGTGPPNRNTNALANVSLNWFEAVYWRAYHPLLDYLACSSATAAGEYQILASGFDLRTIRAYDVTDPTDPRLVTGAVLDSTAGLYSLAFQDSAANGSPRRYVVFCPAFARTVLNASVTAVTRHNLGSMTAGDYLLITPEAFMGAAQALAALRLTQGLNVVVSPLQTVFDEFNGGRRSFWAIKRYIRFGLNRWAARFVMLFGEGTEDPHNYSGESGPDEVPIAKTPGPVAIGDGREIVPSDGWYVWCLNGCGPDPITGLLPPIVPELFIGRLPATTPQEASDMVAKLATYENIAADQTWRSQLLLLSDDDFSSSITFGDFGNAGYCEHYYEQRFASLNDAVRSAIVDTAGLRGLNVDHFKLGTWLAGEPVDANSCRIHDEITVQDITRAGATPALKTRLNAGRMWWNYQGHANEFVLAHENIWRNILGQHDQDDLVNANMPFLFSAFSCHVNAFAHVAERRPITGPPIGESLLLLPGRGAIGSYASVGFEIIPDNGSDHLNVQWARAMFTDPAHDDRGNGDTGARTLLGESIALAYLRYVPSVQFIDPDEAGVALTYTLLGDPATQLSIGAPEALVTANGDTVISGRPVALAVPRDTLHLEADLVSTVQIISIALIEQTSAGSRTVPATDYTLTPPFPDTGPAGSGGRRFHLSFTTPVRPGTLRYTLRTVDRYGLNTDFAVVFQFASQLLASGNVLAENDAVPPTTPLALRLELPTPAGNPATQIALMVDSLPQPFSAAVLDTIGRRFLLNWNHTPYGFGTHRVDVAAFDSLKLAHHFRVVDPAAAGNRLLQNVLAFPNPFDEEVGTTFGLYLIADQPADVSLSVFTISGRLLYTRMEHGMGPGYHQWPWDGRDTVGDRVANGVYLFKVAAQAGSRHDTFEGRLVKLRRPRHSTATP